MWTPRPGTTIWLTRWYRDGNWHRGRMRLLVVLADELSDYEARLWGRTSDDVLVSVIIGGPLDFEVTAGRE